MNYNFTLLLLCLFSDVSVVSKEVKIITDSTISCIVTGISEPVIITWSGYKEDEHHTADPGSLISDSQSSTLHVTSVQIDHTYTCTVSSVQHPTSPAASREVHLDVFSKLPTFYLIYTFTTFKFIIYHAMYKLFRLAVTWFTVAMY